MADRKHKAELCKEVANDRPNPLLHPLWRCGLVPGLVRGMAAGCGAGKSAAAGVEQQGVGITERAEVMKTVYRQEADGWHKVRKCASFRQACKLANKLEEQSGVPHCVNT
jgi:hypothetical protein